MASRGHSSGAKFRASVWDPWLILSQIAAMQSCYYTLLCLATLLMEAFSGQETALAHVLDYRVYRGDTVFGWTLGLGVMGCAAVSVLLLLRIVERARLCLDYVVTLHFLHLIFTSYYSGHLPTTVFWWALNLASCCAMSIGGEWVCMRREMEPIMLSGGNAPAARADDGAHDTAGDEEEAQHRHAAVIHMEDFTDSDAYATEEEGGSGRGRFGAMGKRVARAIGEHKRKRSGVSYEMVPQTVTTATASKPAGELADGQPGRA